MKAKVTPTITKVTDAKVPEEQEGGDDVESEEQAVTTQMGWSTVLLRMQDLCVPVF